MRNGVRNVWKKLTGSGESEENARLKSVRRGELSRLVLDEESEGEENVGRLIEALESTTSIHTLELRSLQASNCAGAAKFLKTNKSISCLKLKEVDVDVDGICRALCENTSVKKLELFECSSPCCRSLGEMLTKNTTLQELCMNRCYLGVVESSEDIEYFLGVVSRHNATLCKMDLSNNRLHDGLWYGLLCDVVRNNASLKSILYGNNLVLGDANNVGKRREMIEALRENGVVVEYHDGYAYEEVSRICNRNRERHARYYGIMMMVLAMRKYRAEMTLWGMVPKDVFMLMVKEIWKRRNIVEEK